MSIFLLSIGTKYYITPKTIHFIILFTVFVDQSNDFCRNSYIKQLWCIEYSSKLISLSSLLLRNQFTSITYFVFCFICFFFCFKYCCETNNLWIFVNSGTCVKQTFLLEYCFIYLMKIKDFHSIWMNVSREISFHSCRNWFLLLRMCVTWCDWKQITYI